VTFRPPCILLLLYVVVDVVFVVVVAAVVIVIIIVIIIVISLSPLPLPPSFSGYAAQCGLWPPCPQGFLMTHNDLPQLVGLLWMSDQFIAETST
jgi:hypothetical protein